MIYAALIFWLVLGLLVIFTAMRGGPAGARATLHTEGRIGRRVRTAAIALVFMFGIGVPIAVAVSNSAHKASAGPQGTKLTADETRGRALFAQKCATCHALDAARAVGRVGPNLDILRPPEALVLNAIANGRARGRGQMPALLYTGSDATNVAKFVAAVAGR